MLGGVSCVFGEAAMVCLACLMCWLWTVEHGTYPLVWKGLLCMSRMGEDSAGCHCFCWRVQVLAWSCAWAAWEKGGAEMWLEVQSKWTLRSGQRPGGRDVSMVGGLEMMVSRSQEKKTRSKDGPHERRKKEGKASGPLHVPGLETAGQGDNRLGLHGSA